MRFECIACGACCRRAGLIPGFPEPTDETGRCVHLMPDNRCSIYERRPLICNVDQVWDEHLAGTITRERWHRLIHAGCNEMMRVDGIPHAFAIEE